MGTAAGKKKAVQGKATVTMKNTDGTEEQHEEQVGPLTLKPEDQVCQVGHKLGYTKNMGNYESLRIDVMITMPCYPHEVEDVSAFEVDWADERMSAIVKNIEEDLPE